MDEMFTLEELEARERFLELRALGVGEINAGLEVGWTPRRTRRELQDPEFAELVKIAMERLDERVEQVLAEQAMKGNMTAIQMWLYNRKPDAWRDVKRIEVRNETTINVGTIHSVKQAAAELLRERGVAAVQELIRGDVIEAEVVDEERD